MFTLASGAANDRWDRARVIVQSLASGERKTVLTGGSQARYLATGHLVYAVGGSLFARPFDLRHLEVTGSAVPMVVGVGRSAGAVTGVAHFSISDTGSLAYVVGSTSSATDPADLALIDRHGQVQPLNLPPGLYVSPRASPDGSRIVFGTDDGKEAIVWTYRLSGGRAMQRLTSSGNNRFPIWTSDSTHVVFQSDREGDRGLFWQSADGTGAAVRLTRPAKGEAHIPESWSPTSNLLMFSVATGVNFSLSTLSLPESKAADYGGVQSAKPIGAVFSPDGRWVAYTSTERGTTTIYVQPFPVTGAKFTLSARGFDTPHEVAWSPDGDELFYNPRPGGFEVVKVTTRPAFAFGIPEAVPRPFLLSPPETRRRYDVTPSGRFLAPIVTRQQGLGTVVAPQVQIVLNWLQELWEKVQVGR